MPMMNGVQMIKTIRSKGTLDEQRLIVITAMDNSSLDVIELRASNILVIQKPFRFDQLQTLIKGKIAKIRTLDEAVI